MKNKILITFLLLVFFTSFISCSEKNSTNTIKDNYEFTLDESAKETYLNNIDKTRTNKFITYVSKNDVSMVYTVYAFKDGFCYTKNIYSFYNDLDSFRKGLKQHENYLDGFYTEVNQSILLIKTFYSSLEKVDYNTLYNTVKNKYEII